MLAQSRNVTSAKAKYRLQMGREMDQLLNMSAKELDIQIICANTPRAKGRVERVIQTLQDCLPKKMHLHGISAWQKGTRTCPNSFVSSTLALAKHHAAM